MINPPSTIKIITDTPTSLLPDDIRKNITFPKEKKTVLFDLSGWHESLLRSYHIVQYIKCFLGCHRAIQDPVMLLEIIRHLEEK